MKLNNRLMMITKQIPQCNILADIGTDHAFIPIYAVKHEICAKALAADLREGPLKIAHENIKKHKLENSIETRLGNGLQPISLFECDVIVIAGMGGQLIRDILAASLEKAHKAKMLILQPNNATDSLRRWLDGNGFHIIGETLALDAGKLYCIMKVKWTDTVVEKDDFAYYIGEKLLESRDPLLKRYLTKKLGEIEVIIEGRSKSKAAGKCELENLGEKLGESEGSEKLETFQASAIDIDYYRHIRDRIEKYMADL